MHHACAPVLRGIPVGMTSQAELRTVADLADRLQLVCDRDDEYPMRVLGEQLREELMRLPRELGDLELPSWSLLDPGTCDPRDLRSRTQCLIDAARRWAALQAEQPAADH